MRKLMAYFCVLLLVLTTQGLIYAQDFTVEIPSTDPCAHYVKPIKAGGNYQLEIKVTNNRSDTCTVSIDKSDMGSIYTWVSIENNEKEILPSQTKNFSLTIEVPTYAGEGEIHMPLDFNAYDKGGTNHPFEYANQIIIVDNSQPDSPTFTVGQTSTTISVIGWDSWDFLSNLYTVKNSSAGEGGIKSYKLIIKTENDYTVKSIDKEFDEEINYHTFQDLEPNTDYKACVTAFDLVGNSKTTEKSVTTAPGKPTFLRFSDITYIGATLLWNPSDGATGYNVYQKISDSVPIKLNDSPITSSSYNLEDLDPFTEYTYFVKALNDVGLSDRSNNASVSTLALPKIDGSSLQCSGIYTYTVEDLVDGYAVSWSSSSNLNEQSTSGASANYTKISDGAAWIGANIVAPNGRVLDLKNKDVWVGKPRTVIESIDSEYDDEPEVPGSFPANSGSVRIKTNAYAYINFGAEILKDENLQWNIDYVPTNICNMMQFGDNVTLLGLNPGMSMLAMQAENQCGEGSLAFVSVTVFDEDNSSPFLSVSPNPTTNYIEVNIDVDTTNGAKQLMSKNNKAYVRLYNNRSIPVIDKVFYSEKFTLDTSTLKQGIYQLILIYNGEKYNKQVIVKH